MSTLKVNMSKLLLQYTGTCYPVLVKDLIKKKFNTTGFEPASLPARPIQLSQGSVVHHGEIPLCFEIICVDCTDCLIYIRVHLILHTVCNKQLHYFSFMIYERASY